MDISLKGKHALVCGASQGIGRATALVLAELGATILLVARDAEALKKVQHELEGGPSRGHSFQRLDMSDADAVRDFGKTLRERTPSIDILVNNSGGPAPGPAHSAEANEFIKAFQQHLLAFHVITQGVLPGMQEGGSGRVINIISTSVKQPLPGLGVSNTIRGAVANWSKTLANELGPYNITVNNVLPGATGTGRLAQIIERKASKQGSTTDDATRGMQAEIPLGRFALPEEIAYAVAFLAGPSGAYINGVNLAVDGGRTGCA